MSSATVRRLLTRAEGEIANDRAWRAREMLGGAMSDPSLAVDPDLLEAYGSLLNTLGDRLHAGKYLFLSGRRGPEYADAIDLYLERSARQPVNQMISQFPGSIRSAGLGNLAPEVRAELRRRGADLDELERQSPRAAAGGCSSKRARAALLLLAAIFVVLALLSMLGFVTVLRWIG